VLIRLAGASKTVTCNFYPPFRPGPPPGPGPIPGSQAKAIVYGIGLTQENLAQLSTIMGDGLKYASVAVENKSIAIYFDRAKKQDVDTYLRNFRYHGQSLQFAFK